MVCFLQSAGQQQHFAVCFSQFGIFLAAAMWYRSCRWEQKGRRPWKHFHSTPRFKWHLAKPVGTYPFFTSYLSGHTIITLHTISIISPNQLIGNHRINNARKKKITQNSIYFISYNPYVIQYP